MKKLLFSLLASFIPLSVVAQSDIGIIFNMPSEESTITSGEAFNLDFEVANSGSSTIFAGDTIFVAYSIGSQIVDGSARYLTLTDDLNPGETSGNIGDTNTFLNFSGLDGDAQFCLVVVYGPVNDSYAETDIDKANNTSCRTFNFTGGSNLSVEEEGRTTNTVYPNPASTFIYFDIANAHRITIYDISGRFLQEIRCTEVEQQKLSLMEFSTGLYVYHVRDINNDIILSDKFHVVK